MNRHSLGLVFLIPIAAGSIGVGVAQADANEKQTMQVAANETLEDRVTRLEGTIAGIVYAAVFDSCLVRVHDDEFSILCWVSPPLTNPQAGGCLENARISTKFKRAPDGSGDVFVLRGSRKATHPVEAVNYVRFCTVYGQSREAFLTDN